MGEKESREFVNNIIFKSKNIAVLLGAGASVCCGLPRASDLLEKIKKTQELEISELKSLIQIKNEEQDIEKYLSRIENAISFYCNEDIKKYEYIKAFYTECIKLISESVKYKEEQDLNIHYNFISKLISTRNEPSKGRVKVFTTNYDTIIEDCCSRHGVVVMDGFSYVGKRVFNPNYFEYDLINNNLTKRNNTPERINNLIYLYKLHGSINWQKGKDGLFYCSNENHNEPVIIIPGDGKFKNSYDSPYLDMIGKFREGLAESELLIIIGYSFSDKHINNIIIEAIKRNPNITILICFRKDKNTPPEPQKADYYFDIQKGQDITKKMKNLEEFAKNCIVISHDKIFEHFANDILTSKLVGTFNKFEDSKKYHQKMNE